MIQMLKVYQSDLITVSFMVNLFLFSVYGQVWKTNRKDVIKARQFSDMFQFIDDVAAINDGQEFEKVWQWIYLLKLEMKCDSSSENEVSLCILK